jgi:hypothetical protein
MPLARVVASVTSVITTLDHDRPAVKLYLAADV